MSKKQKTNRPTTPIPAPATPAAPVPTQTFSITAPTATSVMLVGDFTHWQQNPIRMSRNEGGIWTVSVGLPPGVYHYRFLIDGEWRDDPDCTVRVPNPFGGSNSVREVREVHPA